jgi:hypothetical protein
MAADGIDGLSDDELDEFLGGFTVEDLRRSLVAFANGDERTVDLAVAAAAKLSALLDHTGEVEGLRIIETMLGIQGTRLVVAVIPKNADLLDEEDS